MKSSMKKKFLRAAAACAAVLMIGSLAGCGQRGAGETEAPETSAASNEIADALELLTAVWESYPEDAVFPAAGGDSEEMTMDGPGACSVENAEALDASLAFPADEAGKIDDAASLVHMMNANTFTAGAFRLKEAGDSQAVAQALEENLDGRQWICGFPEEMMIASVDQYLVCAFGTADLVETFQKQLSSVYETVSVVSEGPVSAG